MEIKRIRVPNGIMLGSVSQLLSEGHPVVIMARGNSMSPFIRHERDSVELVFRDSVSEGDIVLAEIAPDHYVLHRVFAADGDNLVLKGDGNLDLTERCRRCDVRGVASRILKPGHRHDIDCSSPCFVRVSRFWRRSPRLFRRIVLGFYRRIKIL